MSKLRQTHFEQEDWNASKDFKSAIIKLEKEVETWHLISILPFLRDRSALLAYQQRAEVDWINKSMRSSKACDVFIFVESRNLNLYFFSFCRLENNSKFGLNYDNDICCWSRIFFNPNYKSFAQCESKAWKNCWLCRIWYEFWVLIFFFKIERDTAS